MEVKEPADRPDVDAGLAKGQGASKSPGPACSSPPRAVPPRRRASKEAVELGRRLGETRRVPFLEIERGIGFFGIEKIRQLAQKAEEIHASGGMPVLTGERPRTLGGIFFYLLRGEIYGAKLGWPKQPRPATLEECRKVAETMTAERDIRSVVITITGRPCNVREDKATTIILMQESQIPSSIPKLLPPIKDANTTFAVYVPTKQWKKVAPVLEEDPDDILVVEGYPKCEVKLGHIEVYAIMVTTRGLTRRLAEARRTNPRSASSTPDAGTSGGK